MKNKSRIKKIKPAKKGKKKSERQESGLEHEIRVREIVSSAEKEIERRGSEQFEFQGEFQDFLEEPEFQESSPSLRKINSSPRSIINLEGDLEEAAERSKVRSSEEDSFKYSAAGANPDSPKYINYGNEHAMDTLPRTQIESLGRNDLFERREAGFMESPEAKFSDTVNFEKYDAIRRVEKEELGKENLFERKDVKYRPSSNQIN